MWYLELELLTLVVLKGLAFPWTWLIAYAKLLSRFPQ